MKYRKKPTKRQYLKNIKKRELDLLDVNPYDLSEVGGFRDECPCCGLRIRPEKISPYDLNYAGFQNFCRCKS
jgi:hypothetical protein